MKLQQLRYVWEVAQHGFKVSAAAESLLTSQPGVSKQIRLLEEELGFDLFVRNGKNFVALTEGGGESRSGGRGNSGQGSGHSPNRR